MSSPGSQRLWVGPLMLILVIALIYVFSLMPSAPPHTRRGYPDYPDMSGEYQSFEKQRNFNDMAFAPTTSNICKNGGILNDTAGHCDCLEGFSGMTCEQLDKTTCLNDGVYSNSKGRCLCIDQFAGDHCEILCREGIVNHTSNTCICKQRHYGPACDRLCENGVMVNETCLCDPGFDGPWCTICRLSHCEETHYAKRRGAVNSRLTLSGLSFCMITIGLLCVTARRRRAGMSPPTDETWYRVFNPNPARPGRCRHDFMCGGSWFPRDRALLVAPGRATISHGARRTQQSRSSSRRLATPPPSYTSVDNLTDEQLPPTYEEATRVLSEDRRELIVDETDKEDSSLPQLPGPSTPTSEN